MQEQEYTQTVHDVAEWLRCGPRKVSDVARENGIGMNLGGRAGWRFTEADKLLIQEALRPAKKVEPRRRRRSS